MLEKFTLKQDYLTCLLSTSLILALSSAPAWAADKIKYGEWEINMTVQGLPLQVPSQSERICLDKQHLVPGQRQSHDCNLKWQIKGATVSWTISCQNGASGKGSAVYHWDTMQGSSDMSMPNTNMQLHAAIHGKWIADKCNVR